METQSQTNNQNTSKSSFNIDLIRESYSAVKPYAMEFVELLTGTLGESNPGVANLVSANELSKQTLGVVYSLSSLIQSYGNESLYNGNLERISKRYKTLGFTSEDFTFARKLLLEGFSKFFGKDWTPALHGQWSSFLVEVEQGLNQDFTPAPQVTVAVQAPQATQTPVVELTVNSAVAAAVNFQSVEKPQIDWSVKTLAHEVLKEAIQRAFAEELKNEAFQKMVQTRVKETLKTALEQEARSMISSLHASGITRGA